MHEAWTVTILGNDTNDEELKKIFARFGDTKAPSAISAPSLKKYWLYAFIRNYGSSRRIAITVVEHQGHVKLIMPLQIKGEKRLEFLCDETSDYNDFFFRQLDSSALKFALDFWASRGFRELQLNGFPADSQSITLLRTVATDMKWEMRSNEFDVIPVVDVQTNQLIENWMGVKTERVKRYQRKLTALSKTSDVSFSLIRTSEQLREEFPAIKHLHLARWNAVDIKSKYADQRRETFILDICEDALKENALFMPLMKINGVLASYIIAFKYNKVVYDWNTSFSLDFQKFSPGALLLLHVLSHSTTYDFVKYNLLKGAEEYKFTWTNKTERNISISIVMESNGNTKGD